MCVEGMASCEVLQQSQGLLVASSTLGTLNSPGILFPMSETSFLPLPSFSAPVASCSALLSLSSAGHVAGSSTSPGPPSLGPFCSSLTVPCYFSFRAFAHAVPLAIMLFPLLIHLPTSAHMSSSYSSITPSEAFPDSTPKAEFVTPPFHASIPY